MAEVRVRCNRRLLTRPATAVLVPPLPVGVCRRCGGTGHDALRDWPCLHCAGTGSDDPVLILVGL